MDVGLFTLDPEHPGLYTTKEPVTLVHAVRPKRKDDWLKKFYEEYEKTGKPPEEWFTFKDGVWTGAVKQIDVNTVSYQTLYDNAAFTYLDRGRRQMILFTANPKTEARWLNLEDPKSMELWLRWSADPKNLAKPNRLTGLKTLYDIDPRPERIWHSAFYDEYKLAGVFQHKGTSVIVRNDRMINESRVFIPRFMNVLKPKTIYHRCPEFYDAVSP